MPNRFPQRLRKAGPGPLDLEYLEDRCLPSATLSATDSTPDFGPGYNRTAGTTPAAHYSSFSSQPSLTTFVTAFLQGGRQKPYASATSSDPYAMSGTGHDPSTNSYGTSSDSTNSSSDPASKGTDNGTGTVVLVAMPFAVSDIPTTPAREASPSVASSSAGAELTFGATGLTAPLWHPAPAGTRQRTESALPVDLAQGPALWHLPSDGALLAVEEAGPLPAGGKKLAADSFAARTLAGPLPAPRGGGLLDGLPSLDLPALGHVVDQFFAALGRAADPLAVEGLAQRLAPWVVAGVLAGGAVLEWRRNHESSVRARGHGRWAGLPEIVPLTGDAS